MSEEMTQVKISMPLIDDIELQRIDNYYNDIVKEYTKAFVKEKEQVIVQRLMINLQQENQQLKEVVDEITKLVNDYEECEKIIGAGKPMFPLYKLQNIIHKVKKVK